MPSMAPFVHSKVEMTQHETAFIQINYPEASTILNRVALQNQLTSLVHHIPSTNQMLHRLTSQGNAMNTESWGFLEQQFYTPVETEVLQAATTSVYSLTGLGAPVHQDSFPVFLEHAHSSLQCASDAFLRADNK